MNSFVFSFLKTYLCTQISRFLYLMFTICSLSCFPAFDLCVCYTDIKSFVINILATVFMNITYNMKKGEHIMEKKLLSGLLI